MKKSNLKLIVIFLSLLVWTNPYSLNGQEINDRTYFPQDTLWLKRIEAPNDIQKKIHLNNVLLVDDKKQLGPLKSLPDTANIIIQYTLTDDTLEILIKDRTTDSLITDYYEYGNFESSKILHSEIRISDDRVFSNIGFLSTYTDTISGEIFIDSYLHSYLLTENYTIVPFGKLPYIRHLIDYKYAWGTSYYYPGWDVGFDVNTENFAVYHFGANSIIKDNSYSISFGGLLEFMDGKNNTIGHLFHWRHPDVGNTYLEVTDTNLNLLFNIETYYPVCASFYNGGYAALPINGSINYLLVTSDFSSEGNYVLVVDLEKRVIKDTLITPFKIAGIAWGTRNELLFYPESSEDQYIIDYSKFETQTIDLTNFLEINDTLGRIYQCNIFGNNLRFKSLNDICSVDSVTGTITLVESIESIPEGESVIPFLINDGYGPDTVLISLFKPLGIYEKTEILTVFPNPVANVLNIKNNDLQPAELLIYTLQGVILKQLSITAGGLEPIDMNFLLNGIYLLTLEVDGQLKLSKKIIVNR